MMNARPEEIGLRERLSVLALNPNAKALIVGATAIAVAPVVLPLAKPVFKATVKTGFMLYEKTRTAIAETGEVFADIVAEAQAEAVAESRTLPGATAAANPVEAEGAES